MQTMMLKKIACCSNLKRLRPDSLKTVRWVVREELGHMEGEDAVAVTEAVCAAGLDPCEYLANVCSMCGLHDTAHRIRMSANPNPEYLRDRDELARARQTVTAYSARCSALEGEILAGKAAAKAAEDRVSRAVAEAEALRRKVVDLQRKVDRLEAAEVKAIFKPVGIPFGKIVVNRPTPAPQRFSPAPQRLSPVAGPSTTGPSTARPHVPVGTLVQLEPEAPRVVAAPRAPSPKPEVSVPKISNEDKTPWAILSVLETMTASQFKRVKRFLMDPRLETAGYRRLRLSMSEASRMEVTDVLTIANGPKRAYDVLYLAVTNAYP
ncbi:putative capsid maturation protease [Epizootic haematopoietic necrosis virus]|uniref:Putative capsid maturation protease n=1 Tax=Epizootic haematopoietic necrosis virus TaxID=100217 RepID=D3TTU7_9VIRU|nr:putative capsid maturation protease [Epizootic haematopoietic necrosis virus]ACO25254.1 putative capsid maturation protease [Epizootic haematopoietic necrosis virus]QNN79857.1 putative capsid maturation protease [Epizootic haematopoietic necrosis virus]QNN80057.1 putative capsid maturation protease [Epizootic haematopoietic necrosis virus]